MANPLYAQLLAKIESVEIDPAARRAAINAGRDQATFCAYCHGADGNSAKPEIPNLAGQNPVYLLDQIENFASGKRKDYTTVMQQLSRQFSASEKLALAVYYASVPLKPASAANDLAKRGKPIYVGSCQGCHGERGEGPVGYARIAGQQPEYIQRTLRAFRDRKEGRTSELMSQATASLSDQDIRAVAAYVANLR